MGLPALVFPHAVIMVAAIRNIRIMPIFFLKRFYAMPFFLAVDNNPHAAKMSCPRLALMVVKTP